MDKNLSFIEADVESTDDSVRSKSKFELFSFVYLIANVIVSWLDEKDLVYFVKLYVYNLSLSEDSWFKWLQNVDHEILILDIIPSVKAIINSNLFTFTRGLFWEIKELTEVFNEAFEKEVTINLTLDRCRELLKKFVIFVGAHSLVSVINPSVIEVLLDFELEIVGDRPTWVESFNETEPLRQVFTVVRIRVQILDGNEDLNEVTHDVWKDCNTNKQNKSANRSFIVTPRMIISEADCGQSCKGIVSDNDHSLMGTFLIQAKPGDETIVEV